MSRPTLSRRPELPDPYADVKPVPAVSPPTPAVPAPDDLCEQGLRSLEEMNPALRAKVLEMRELMLHEREGLLDSRYKLGTLVLEVKKDVETYGNLSDVQLAGFFGDSRSVLTEARRIRERYSPEEFERIKSMCNPHNGARLSYSHLANLLRIEDRSQADKVLTQCLQAGWSTKELASYINKRLREQSGQSKSSRSRPKPDNFLGLVENATAYTIDFKKQYDEVWRQGAAFVEAYDALSDEQIDESLVEKIKELRHQAQVLAEAVGYLAEEFARLRHRAEETIGDRRKGDGKAKAQVRTIEDDDEDQDDEE